MREIYNVRSNGGTCFVILSSGYLLGDEVVLVNDLLARERWI
jgi:Tfp pilus assembly protein PilZ